MRAEIIKIHDLQYSRNGNTFIRVEFQMENSTWAKTDICPDYRNYERWKNYLKVGAVLENLKLKRAGEIDADSFVEPYRPKRIGHWKENADGSMAWVDDDTPITISSLKPIQLKQGSLI